MSSSQGCTYLHGRTASHHFVVGENTVKGNRLTFICVQLWSEVDSCVLGVYRSCVPCIQTLSLLRQTVLLLKVTAQGALLPWHL